MRELGRGWESLCESGVQVDGLVLNRRRDTSFSRSEIKIDKERYEYI